MQHAKVRPTKGIKVCFADLVAVDGTIVGKHLDRSILRIVRYPLLDLIYVTAVFAVYVSPALVAFVWAYLSKIRWVKRALISTAKLVVLVFIFLFLISYSAEYLCDGSVVKGFTQCSVIPTMGANFVGPVITLSICGLIVRGLVVVVRCGWAEYQHFHKRKTGR